MIPEPPKWFQDFKDRNEDWWDGMIGLVAWLLVAIAIAAFLKWVGL